MHFRRFLLPNIFIWEGIKSMAMNLGKLVLAEFTEELSFLIKGKRIYFGNSKFLS